ncbi:hypothetical protein ALC57_11045 [Trachymyrmex cornetzi]|uniref:MADF domain-containing protein n=1 Tax=Trachymyrmex cornetzi TaxID=471704 RepID=A0A151J2X5_9HYME|nr:hypothetical protein ALC57_11045 [Trachymyrmex cornetzi]
MESLNLDEIIIEFVRENRCLYDKRDVNLKNIRKKKDLWQKLSENLRNCYTLNMSVEEIERRWSSSSNMGFYPPSSYNFFFTFSYT